jgi:hypothetical protein
VQPSVPKKAQGGQKSIYAVVTTSGTEVKMLVDTGSERTLLHTDVFRQLPSEIKCKLKPQAESVFAANGETLKVEGVVDLVLNFGKQSVVHPVIVANIPILGIIGFDFLETHEAEIFPSRGGLRLNGHPVPVVCEHVPIVNCCRIAVASTVVLQPGSETLVPGKLVRGGFAPKVGMVEATESFLSRDRGVLVARTVVDATADEIPLRLVNLSSDPSILYQGTHVALIQPVEVCSQLESSGNQREEISELSPKLEELLGRCSSDLTEEERKQVSDFVVQHRHVFSEKGELG